MKIIITNVSREDIEKLNSAGVNWYTERKNTNRVVITGDAIYCDMVLEVLGLDY